MTATLSSTALAWLLTYAIHSSVLLSLVWLLVRVRRWSPGASELLWKSALIGGIVTATVQLSLDVRPAGTVTLHPSSVTTSAPSASIERAPRISTPVQPTDIPTTPEPSAERVPAMTITTSSVVVLVWVLVALMLGFSYVARRLILVGRLGDRRAVPDGRLHEMLLELARDAGLRRTPRLTCTSRISSPIALGISEICVPDTALTDLDVDQQRSLLAHELAHLARRDPLWLGVSSLVERIFWFQPLNRVANREIATSAEFLCDDWAVRRTGSGAPLARCLAQVAEWIQASPLGVPVAGMAEERSLLVSRVARLIEGVTPPARSRRGLAIAATAVLVATILVAPGVSGTTRSLLIAGVAEKLAAPDANSARESGKSAVPPARPPIVASIEAAESVAAPDTNIDASVIDALVARLQDENAEVRRAAAHSLGHLEDTRAVPGLIGALKDAEPEVRAAVAEALGELEDSRAIVPLASLLNDPSVEVKRSALDALSHFEADLPSAAVIRLLSDPDTEIRHAAAHLAGKLRDRSATGALAKLTGDPSSEVRQAAIRAIGELRDPAATAAVVSALSDANAEVREQALSAIDDLRAPLPEATLIGLLRDRDPDVRQQAARLAGDRSIIGAIPELRRMLDDPNGDVRETAVGALGDIADAAAYDALRVALTSKDAKVRRAAAEALGERRP